MVGLICFVNQRTVRLSPRTKIRGFQHKLLQFCAVLGILCLQKNNAGHKTVCFLSGILLGDKEIAVRIRSNSHCRISFSQVGMLIGL